MTKLTLPASDFAPTWLNVSLSSSDDEARPVLYKTVLIEVFSHGVQLVATDSFMLMCGFAPTAQSDLTNPPSLDEAPEATYIVMDPDQRMRSLMRHMRKEAKAAEKESRSCDVTLSFKSAETLDVPTLDPSLDRMACVVDAGAERLTLPLYEGEFINWRPLLAREPEAVQDVWFSPYLLGRFGKLVDVGVEGFHFQTAGSLGVCTFRSPEVRLFGGIMPMHGAGTP